MPQHVWIKYAWMQSVDPETYRHTTLLGVSNNTLSVRCHSPHAAQTLENNFEIVKKWNSLNLIRPLPRIERIRVLLGKLAGDAQKTDASPLPDQKLINEYSNLVGDDELGSLLAKLALKNNVR